MASYSSALDLTNCVQYMGTFSVQSPLFEHIKSFRTCNKTQVFHFITSRDVRSCVNICTMTSTALANIDCEGFSINIFYLVFLSYLFSFHIDYTHRILKHGYVLALTLLFHFWNNIIIIHNTGKRGLFPFIILFACLTYN